MEAPAIFTEAEFYQRNFDPHEYLKEFYSMSTSREGASAFMMQNLRNLHKTFSLGKHSRGVRRRGPAPLPGLPNVERASSRTPLCLHVCPCR